MTLWKIWEFHCLLYLNLNGREQRLSIGCQQQVWNSGDVAWTVTVVQQWVLGTDVKQWRCCMNGHKQWFSNGYWEQTWNNGDAAWTVTNSGSAMGTGNRRETMAILHERSQTQSTLVTTYPQGCPVKIVYIWGSFKLRFKVTMQLMPFKLCLF